jgi:hypothetical protein
MKATSKVETTTLFSADTPNLSMRIARITAPVIKNPTVGARAMNAAIRMITRIGLNLFGGGPSSSGASSVFTVAERRPCKTTTPPKKMKRMARTLGNRDGPGCPPSSSG